MVCCSINFLFIILFVCVSSLSSTITNSLALCTSLFFISKYKKLKKTNKLHPRKIILCCNITNGSVFIWRGKQCRTNDECGFSYELCIFSMSNGALEPSWEITKAWYNSSKIVTTLCWECSPATIGATYKYARAFFCRWFLHSCFINKTRNNFFVLHEYLAII